MRIYFTSSAPAALKLDGQYCGIIDGFERYAEVLPCGAFAEIVPEGGYLPVNFFTRKDFFSAPPENVSVYNIYGGKLVRVRYFYRQRESIRIISQKRFCGNIFTLFCEGGTYASCEGARGGVYPMPEGFEGEFEEADIGGSPYLCLRDGRYMALFAADGGLCFLGKCQSAEFGGRLVTCSHAEDSADRAIFTAYNFDGQKFVCEGSRTEERREPCALAPHLAFFDSVLCRGDCARYLSAELQPKAGNIYSYLGNFTEVLVPDGQFFEKYGDVAAAGLACPDGRNTFTVKYFICDVEGGVICNIYPAE